MTKTSYTVKLDGTILGTRKTIELNYNVRVAQGHRFCKDVVREWPEGATLADVMAELTTELRSLGCSDITVTRRIKD
jgi:hypothetical protein